MALPHMTEHERQAFLAEPRVGVLSVASDTARPPLTVRLLTETVCPGKVWNTRVGVARLPATVMEAAVGPLMFTLWDIASSLPTVMVEGLAAIPLKVGATLATVRTTASVSLPPALSLSKRLIA